MGWGKDIDLVAKAAEDVQNHILNENAAAEIKTFAGEADEDCNGTIDRGEYQRYRSLVKSEEGLRYLRQFYEDRACYSVAGGVQCPEQYNVNVKVNENRCQEVAAELLQDPSLNLHKLYELSQKVSGIDIPGIIRTQLYSQDRAARFRTIKSLQYGPISNTSGMLGEALGSVAYAGDENRNLRFELVGAIYHQQDASVAKPYLLEALENDENNNVRSSAASALGEIGGEGVKDALVDALDEGGNVQHSAIYGLKDLGDPSTVENLLEIAADFEMEDMQDDWLAFTKAKAAAEAIRDICDETSVETLLEFFQEEQTNPTRRIRSFVIKPLIEALGRCAKGKAVDLIIAAIEDEEDAGVQARLFEALSLSSDPRAKAWIKALPPDKCFTEVNEGDTDGESPITRKACAN